MTYISLYRKWRPQSLSQLVGQDHVARTLANSIQADHVGHAYMFAGPRGTGKTSTAKILAKSVNCREGPTAEPCGRCESCRTIAGGTSLDVIEMDAASNRGIDEIRELREKVAFAAAIGRKKVYIIDEVHMLTEHAFNALLKTLEEPPSHVIFILATTDPNKVPITIASRCQHFEFRPIPMNKLSSHLEKISKAEKISASKESLALIARQAEGSLRDAIGMLDQLSTYTDKTITKEDAIKFLGLIDSSLVEACVDLITSGQNARVFEFVESLSEAGRDLRQFTGALLSHLRDLFILSHVSSDEQRHQLVSNDDEAIERLLKQSKALGAARIRSFLTEVGRLYEGIKTATEPRLSLELTLIGLMRGDELTVEALARRLDRLEGQTDLTKALGKQGATGEKHPSAAEPKDNKKRTGNTSKAAKKTDGKIDIGKVKAAWADILGRAKEKKLSLYAYLVEGQPTAVDNGSLQIVFRQKSAFSHQELKKELNAALLKDVLTEALGVELGFEAVLNQDLMVEPVADTRSGKSVKAFDESEKEESSPDAGEKDVLNLIKQSFGAEVVDESASLD